MAKRAVRMSVCSGCINDFPDKDMYTVAKYMNRTDPNPKDVYYTPYCEKCVKKTDQFAYVHKEPKAKQNKTK